MNKKDLEDVFYFLLGTLTGLSGLIAAIFMAYITNYKECWRMIIGFLIGWIIYAIFVAPNLTNIGILIYSFIIGIIVIIIAYIIKKNKLKNG